MIGKARQNGLATTPWLATLSRNPTRNAAQCSCKFGIPPPSVLRSHHEVSSYAPPISRSSQFYAHAR